MKATETREETLARLARDAHNGRAAVKRFEALVKRVANTSSPAVKAKAPAPSES